MYVHLFFSDEWLTLIGEGADLKYFMGIDHTESSITQKCLHCLQHLPLFDCSYSSVELPYDAYTQKIVGRVR